MDTRILFVGIALLFLCVAPAGAQFYATIERDAIVDVGNSRFLEIDVVTTYTDSDYNGSYVSIGVSEPSTLPTYAINAGTNESLTVRSSSCNSVLVGTPCTQLFTTVFSVADYEQNCIISGSLTYNYQICNSTSCGPSTPLKFSLVGRSLCKTPLQYTLNTNIVSYGAYADQLFSQTKDTYYINDDVYFPFQITYADLTISQVTFEQITVSTDESSVDILASSSITAEGNAVGLQLSPLSTQLNSGSAKAWFSVQISRTAGSPFASTAAPLTTYTLTAVLNVSYKNAKRTTVKVVGRKLYSEATIKVSREQGKAGNLPSK